MKERENYFDFARALLIIFIIFGHLSEGYWRIKPDEYYFFKSIWIFIYYFHIPAFAMISGYLSVRSAKNPDFEKLFRTLIIPYIIFQILYRLYLFRSYGLSDWTFHFFSEPYTHLWYLLSLFFWRAALPFFRNIKHAFILVLLAGIFSIFMPDAAQFFGLGRTIRFFPYFFLGAVLNEKGILPSHMKNDRYLAAAGIVFCAVLAVHALFNFEGEDMKVIQLFSYGNDNPGISLLHQMRIYMMGISLSFIFFVFAANISERFKFMSYIGKYSLYPFVLHMFIVAFALNRGYLGKLDAIYGNQWIVISLIFPIAVVSAFILASWPVRKIFKYLLEPELDFIHRYGAYIFIAGMAVTFVLQNYKALKTF